MSLSSMEELMERYSDHHIVREVLGTGGALAESSRDLEAKLRQVELGSIEDYVAESENLEALSRDIDGCDAVLGGMEATLEAFQNNLGSISQEIRSLQEQSVELSHKLTNRKAAEEILGRVVDSVALPPAMVAGVLESEVSEEYLGYLNALSRKIKTVATDPSLRGARALRDVEPELELLRVKAVSKAREFLAQRVYDLRRPKTNVQIQQQTRLLKFRHLVGFLRTHSLETYVEVRNMYVETVGRIYQGYFRTYLAAVDRLQRAACGRGDVIGLGDGGAGGVLGGLMGAMKMPGGLGGLGKALGGGGGRTRGGDRPLRMGARGLLLRRIDQAAIVPHIAESEGKKFPYEVLFRSLYRLLLDTATSEYLFCTDFWGDTAVFDELIAPVLDAIREKLEEDLPEVHDAVSLLLMICVNHKHRLVMQRRRVPGLDQHLDAVNLLLWPRFKALFDLQVVSLRGTDPRLLVPADQSVQPHPLSQRYADFAVSMLQLNASLAQEDGQLGHNLERLRGVYCNVLRAGAGLFRERARSAAWLANNYSVVVGALQDAREGSAEAAAGESGGARGGAGSGAGAGAGSGAAQALGQAGEATVEYFEELLAKATSAYVDETLGQHIGPMLSFVKSAEGRGGGAGGSGAGADETGFDPAAVAMAGPILADFTRQWKISIQTIHKQVMANFADEFATEVLKAALTKLLLTYTKMLDVLKEAGPPGAALLKEAINVPSIMYEIKKYSRQ